MGKYIKYGLIVFVISILIGFLIGKFFPTAKNDNSQDVAIENIVGNTTNVGTKLTVQTSSSEKRVSPDATLVIEKNYRDCKHVVKNVSEIPTEMIDLTKAEIEENYSDWILKSFSEDEVSLYKVMDGICNEHFIITDESGKIVVYKLEENYDKNLYEKTNISTEYLTDEDLRKLEEGIYVYGVGTLNSTLESFE